MQRFLRRRPLSTALFRPAAAALMAALITACGGGGSAAASATGTTAAPGTPAASSCTATATVMPNQSSSTLPFCASLSADPDGDGQGSEGGKACQMRSGFDITAAMGAGWNLGNTMDATGQTADTLADETNWGNPRTTQAIIDAVKKAGFSSLRLPISWDDHVSGSGWTIHKAWLDRAEEIAGYALTSGMTVIVNIHHNGGWEAPTLANESRAADVLGKLWPQIAQRFEKYDHHVVFETMNEPRVAVAGVDDWWGKPEYYDVLNRLNVVALNAIRATGGNNLRRLVMLPGYAATATAEQTNALVLPKDKNIAVSVHAYSPYDFALNQKGASTFSGQAELDEMFTRLNKKFVQAGTPVVMGEWASTDKNNLAERVKHAAYFARAARLAGIPAFWWDNGNMVWSATSSDIMGVIDRRTLTVSRPEIVDAIQCATR